MKLKNIGKKFFTNLLLVEIIIILFFIFVGSLSFSFIEGYTLFDSLYFMVMTMSTVGYGDIIPHTQAGKVLVMIYAFMGIPLFVSLSGLILESRFNKTIKGYLRKVYKDIDQAEEEIKKMETRVAEEITDVMQETQDAIQETQDSIEETQDAIEETQDAIEETQDDVQENTKKLKKIEKIIDTNS